jgi:hypothetical protein
MPPKKTKTKKLKQTKQGGSAADAESKQTHKN